MSDDRTRLVQHFDHHDSALRPPLIFDVYDSLREQAPLCWTDRHEGFWTSGRYDEVRAMASDHTTFCSGNGVFIPQVQREPVVPLEVDPPEHKAYRTIFSRVLSPARVDVLRPMMEHVAGTLVSGFVADGGGDFVRSVSAPYPLQIVCQLIGLDPAASGDIRRLTDEMWDELGDGAPTGGFDALVGYLMAEVARRVDSPGEDLITELLNVQQDGANLSVEMVSVIVVVLAVAGHESTMNTCSNLAFRLAEDPERQRLLRVDPTQIAAFVEESLRLDTPTHLMSRTATRDTEVSGTVVRAGERVMLNFGAANRDPRRFDNPAQFQLGRPANRHLAFGWGLHQCVGAQLARAELHELVRTLTQDAPPLVLDGEPTVGPLVAGHHLSIRQLPVRFDG